MIERRKIIKSQSSPPVQKFSKRKERVGELNVSNASRATHRKPNNANHRRSLSPSLFQTRARERERELSLPRSAVKERERERDLWKNQPERRERARDLSRSRTFRLVAEPRDAIFSLKPRARARAHTKKKRKTRTFVIKIPGTGGGAGAN